MSAQTTRRAPHLPWTPFALLLTVCALAGALVTGVSFAEDGDSDVSASLTKDEVPGDGLAWDLGIDNDGDTFIDEDPTMDGVDDDGDGADGEDPALDVVAAGRAQLIPVRLAFAAGELADELTLTASIAGPVSCNPRWITGGEQLTVLVLGSIQVSQLVWREVPFAALEDQVMLRKYSVRCPAGAHSINVYAHAVSATGTTDPASLNNLAENQLKVIVTADVDGDGIANDMDICPWLPDSGVDTDADGIGDACDIDDDGDHFTDALELVAGTEPLMACAATSEANDEHGADAWPPDFNDDRRVNTHDVLAYRPYMTGVLPYAARFDLDGSGAINILDVGVLRGFMATSC